VLLWLRSVWMFQILEIPYLLGNGALGGQALDARGAKESADALGPAEYVLDIVRLGNRAAMTKDQNVGADGDGGFPDGLNAINRLIERDGCPGADCPFCRPSHVRDQKVCACSCHGLCLIFIEDIRAGEQVQLVRSRNHLNFLGVSHAGFLETFAEATIDQPHRRKVLHSGKAHLFEVAKKQIHDSKRIGSTDAG
jgi:hypothetical protein